LIPTAEFQDVLAGAYPNVEGLLSAAASE
jgi:hypothetical protein